MNHQTLQVVTDSVSLLTNDSRQEFCKHVENVEKEYWRRDMVVPGGVGDINTPVLTIVVTLILQRDSNDTSDRSIGHKVKARNWSLDKSNCFY